MQAHSSFGYTEAVSQGRTSQKKHPQSSSNVGLPSNYDEDILLLVDSAIPFLHLSSKFLLNST